VGFAQGVVVRELGICASLHQERFLLKDVEYT
jgi:hypothetical protein